MTLFHRWAQFVELTPACWLWHGTLTCAGYGRIICEASYEDAALIVRTPELILENARLRQLLARIKDYQDMDYLLPQWVMNQIIEAVR